MKKLTILLLIVIMISLNVVASAHSNDNKPFSDLVKSIERNGTRKICEVTGGNYESCHLSCSIGSVKYVANCVPGVCVFESGTVYTPDNPCRI